MKHFLLAFLFATCFFAFNELSASHLMGGDVTYKSIGGKKYLLTFRVYRDCRGIPFSSPDIRIFGGSYNKAVNYTRISIEDITPKCYDTMQGPCSPANQTIGTEGVELHTFTATIDFAVAPYDSFVMAGVCQVYISIEQCCRSGAITTISAGNFYVHSMINICNSKYNNSSPQFRSSNHAYPLCNAPLSYNFGAYDYVDFDSLKFEMIAPMNATNVNESYTGNFNPNIPMTPYCPPNPGVINCKPLPNLNPPRGFYFNPLNGDIILSPTKCDEVAVICVKISEYRKDTSGVWRNLGFVIRENQITVKNLQPKNYLHTNTIQSSYRFIYGENKCIDIATFDTLGIGYSSTNKGDVTSMRLIDKPVGMTFRYIDSTAKNKTGRLCWNVPDSIYSKAQGISRNKNIPITMEIKDNFCTYPYIVRKTINIQVTNVDSFGRLTIKTYDDKNRNHLKDGADTLMSLWLKPFGPNAKTYKQTDNKGNWSDTLWNGPYKIGIIPHPYYAYTSNDTTVTIKKDSTSLLNLIIGRSPGIYGRIYQDANSNCKYDLGEKTFQGYKVYTDSNKYTGISDQNGLYYIKAPKGTYTLRCEKLSSKFAVTCPSSKTISITIDGLSAYYNNDFGVIPNTDFTDLSVGLTVKALGINVSNNWITFYCKNNGTKTRKNIQIKCPLPANVPLYLNSVKVANEGTTATIQIDSIRPGQTFSKIYEAKVSSTYFKTNDKIVFTCFTDSLSTLADSIRTNNTATEYRIVNGYSSINEKRISKDSILRITDSSISYTIHFQNQGTDTVTRAVVTDTLDRQYLDVSKFTLNWSDYPCETIISDNVITFIFNNIKMPNSGTTARAGINFTVGLRKANNDLGFSNKAFVILDFQNPFSTSKAIARTASPIVLQKVMKPMMCRYEKNKAYYSSNFIFGSGNQMILELSDNAGSFSSPLVLKTVNTQSKADSIDFIFPKSMSSGTYKLRIRSTNPAFTSFPAAGHLDLTVAPAPVFTITTNMNNNGICDKDTLKITCNNAQYFYKTLKNNISLNNFTAIRVYKHQVNTGDKFKVISMDNSTLCRDTLAVNLTVFPKPNVTLNTMGNKTDFCINDVFTLQGNGAKYYQFLRNDTIIQARSLIDTTASSVLNFTAGFKVFGESADGCTNMSAGLTLVLNKLPDAFVVSAAPKNVCVGDSFTLNYFGDPGYTYITYRNDSVIRSKTSQVFFKTIVHNLNDKFAVIAMNPKGCSLKNNSVDITINPKPAKPVISKSGNTLSVDPTGISKFQWYKNGVLLSNTGSSIVNAPSGTYKITVTNAGGCKTVSDDFTHFNTGTTDPAIRTIKVYPNPANELLTVENPGNTNYVLYIYDLTGKLVMSSIVEQEKADIDISQLSAGMYLLKTTDRNGVLQVELISINR